ncbi:hypothetical protein PR048_019140 [Dryococelus australis]|uniref:Uncharacterized protein n=1 Tax=Dryococelus australis TaxID=614101 RepID=A0ABQ9H2S3_9NEOP|nr:hypothetical protein PR048_019140 [Dryococelus australis]
MAPEIATYYCNNHRVRPLAKTPSTSQRLGTWTPKRHTDIGHCKAEPAAFTTPASFKEGQKNGCVRSSLIDLLDDTASSIKIKSEGLESRRRRNEVDIEQRRCVGGRRRDIPKKTRRPAVASGRFPHAAGNQPRFTWSTSIAEKIMMGNISEVLFRRFLQLWSNGGRVSEVLRGSLLLFHYRSSLSSVDTSIGLTVNHLRRLTFLLFPDIQAKAYKLIKLPSFGDPGRQWVQKLASYNYNHGLGDSKIISGNITLGTGRPREAGEVQVNYYHVMLVMVRAAKQRVYTPEVFRKNNLQPHTRAAADNMADRARRESATSRTCVHNKLHITKATGPGAPCGERLHIGRHKLEWPVAGVVEGIQLGGMNESRTRELTRNHGGNPVKAHRSLTDPPPPLPFPFTQHANGEMGDNLPDARKRMACSKLLNSLPDGAKGKVKRYLVSGQGTRRNSLSGVKNDNRFFPGLHMSTFVPSITSYGYSECQKVRAVRYSNAKSNSIWFERASRKKSSDTRKTPYGRVKLCRERKMNIKAPERVNVVVFTQNKRLCPQHNHAQFLC